MLNKQVSHHFTGEVRKTALTGQPKKLGLLPVRPQGKQRLDFVRMLQLLGTVAMVQAI